MSKNPKSKIILKWLKGQRKQVKLEEFLIKAHKEIPEKAEEYGDYFYRLAKSLSGRFRIIPKEDSPEKWVYLDFKEPGWKLKWR